MQTCSLKKDGGLKRVQDWEQVHHQPPYGGAIKGVTPLPNGCLVLAFRSRQAIVAARSEQVPKQWTERAGLGSPGR